VPGAPEADSQSEELAALIGAIRERVRAAYPEGAVSGVALPDLLPVLHARDAALAKVAAIGTVNPRPPGPLNAAVQVVKRAIARLLEWHVREQVEFNRSALAAIEATLEALNANNRALVQMAVRVAKAEKQVDDERATAADWRAAWEQRLASTENELLRTIAELKAAFDFRAGQNAEQLEARLGAGLAALRIDLEKARADYEHTIHTELRLIRQRAALPANFGDRLPCPRNSVDAGWFAERFRGPQDKVRTNQRFYVPHFAGCRDVLDLGCGRGEFLELMREAGIPARGVEASAEAVAVCRSKGLEVEQADLGAHLAAAPDESLGGIFCAHVVEHLPPERLPELIRTAAEKLRRSGVLAIETPNPECLAIFATHFYLDPTHVRPVPPALLRFYAEEAGFGNTEVHRLSPAVEETPALASLPADFREVFFGGLDYALIARKP
jgi:2-polyprenyl-3-methyl-5-hydroxy-6-metoxy-1,4-benzoquinol methylase